jgi:murein DD-endopeptidase MepM/ murein hydrolase activator NlpD
MKEIYRFDDETFQYVRVKRNLKFYLKHYALYIALAFFLSFGVIFAYYQIFDSKEVKAIKEQNKRLAQLTQYYEEQTDSIRQVLDSLQAKDKELYRLILNADPIEKTDSQSSPPKITTATPSNAKLDELNAKLNSLNEKLKETNERKHALNDLANLSKDDLRKIPTMRPVASEIISGFGKRKNPITKLDKAHNGIDFKANIGTPVKATADGVVSVVNNYGSGIGNYITINHSYGYATTYGCLSRVKVNVGQRVKRGQVIAETGNTGLSKGPHLHYEVTKNGKHIDPIDYFMADLSQKELIEFKKKASQYNESMD